MKKKFSDFLKNLGMAVVLVLSLAVCVFGVFAELFPAAIPDWALIAGQIISAPFVIAFFIFIFKEWSKQCKSKKEEQKPSP